MEPVLICTEDENIVGFEVTLSNVTDFANDAVVVSYEPEDIPANELDRANDDVSAHDEVSAHDALGTKDAVSAHDALVANEDDNPYDALLDLYDDDANVANDDEIDCDAQLADTLVNRLICADAEINPTGMLVMADQSVPTAVANADHSEASEPYFEYNVELNAPFRRTNKLPTGALNPTGDPSPTKIHTPVCGSITVR